MEELSKKIAEAKLNKKINDYFCPERKCQFTRSIGLCFKYVVLGVNKQFDRHFSLYQSISGWTCDIGLGDVEASAEIPAHAFCKAVEKLIDGGK